MADPAFHVRPAIADDASAIVSINISCWQHAYASILAPSILARRSADTVSATARWRSAISHPSNAASIFVAEEGGRVLGFGSCEPQRDHALREAGFDGEITTLYVSLDHQRSGIGAALMQALLAALIRSGHIGASLWVLEGNSTARRFYERLGAERLSRSKREARLGDVVELAYGWHDLGTLAFPNPVFPTPVFRGDQ